MKLSDVHEDEVWCLNFSYLVLLFLVVGIAYLGRRFGSPGFRNQQCKPIRYLEVGYIFLAHIDSPLAYSVYEFYAC